ncbi:hypothetical protein EDD36DRAFT_449568 [Exophiala viscosa]|uniref:Uncharacterized protein n=1 Tax=Exophiala viscosa TaxID=2486360 RepID=A0AAN6I9K8_9EURO|nr:hypothetical protein EDD36DRAFT_449568 [Exophiala viscosa]
MCLFKPCLNSTRHVLLEAVITALVLIRTSLEFCTSRLTPSSCQSSNNQQHYQVRHVLPGWHLFEPGNLVRFTCHLTVRCLPFGKTLETVQCRT